jgi:ABC-type multidrug transport system permease subunit
MFYGLWDGLYFLLLTAYLIASLMFGLALRRGTGADQWIGIGFLVIALLTVLNFFAGYEGPAWTGAVAGWGYPAVQPVLRLATGVWLWRRATVT